MGNYWWYITVVIYPENAERIVHEENEEILYSAAEISGSIGTEVQELPNGTRMRIYYRSDCDLASWRNRLLDALAPWPQVRVEDMGKIENQQWHQQSEDAFPPLEVGERLVVLAPWHKDREPSGRIPIYINPGSAFGTGYHESTQAVLELLQRRLALRKEIGRVVDVGTGSGILSVAALKLGAESVRARDLDPAVVDEVEANFALNCVDGERIAVEVGNLLAGVEDRYDLLFANILLEPLLEMLPDVARVLVPGGTAIFSGMTERERGMFLEALSATPLVVVDELVKEEWWGVAAQNPS